MEPYRSLYALYNPILSAGKSGILSLTHTYLDDSAKVAINSGEILNAWTQGRTGFAALKEVLRWISFSSKFSLATSVSQIQSPSVDMCMFLTLAKKTESTTKKLLSRIPDSEVRVQIDLDAYGRLWELEDDYRSLASELTDPISIKRVVCKTGLSELHAFYRIHRLLNAGIAILVL